MTKAELISKVAECENIPTKKAAKEAVDTVVAALTESFIKGEGITFVGFGTFSIKEKKATTATNPRTKQKIKIPAKKVVKFKASKALQEQINPVKTSKKSKK